MKHVSVGIKMHHNFNDNNNYSNKKYSNKIYLNI